MSQALAERWWQTLRDSRAVWQHPGDPKAPHVVLRGGKHSDGFIDMLFCLSKVENLVQAARDLAMVMRPLLQRGERGEAKPDWIFGSPMAGIPIAVTVAPILGARHVGFTEKKGDKELICRFEVPPGARVLLIEEMTTTGGTPQRGIDAIIAKNPDAVIDDVVGAFLIRCSRRPEGLHRAELVPVVDLLAMGIRFNEWEPSECPLCAAGSFAIENCKRVWHDLLATMENPGHVCGWAQKAPTLGL